MVSKPKMPVKVFSFFYCDLANAFQPLTKILFKAAKLFSHLKDTTQNTFKKLSQRISLGIKNFVVH